MSTVVNIPLTTLVPGTYEFPPSGGAALQDSFSQAYLSIDRTVAGGFNSVATSVTATLTIYQSDDGGNTWLELTHETFAGGVVIMHENGQEQTISDLGVTLYRATGRLARAQVIIAGGSVAVQGSLTLS